MILSPQLPSLTLLLCLTVSPFSRALGGAASGQFLGENLLLLRGGGERALTVRCM